MSFIIESRTISKKLPHYIIPPLLKNYYNKNWELQLLQPLIILIGIYIPPCVFWTKKIIKQITVQWHSVWKSPRMSDLNFSILAFSTYFWPIKTDLSGNSVWPQALGFQKLAKLDHFWHFLMNFCPLKFVNEARFARNVEWDFFCDFKTPCVSK